MEITEPIPIELKRKASAPIFIDDRGGQYPNPRIEVRRLKDHEFGKLIVLIFSFYANKGDEFPSMSFTRIFDSSYIEPKTAPDGTVLELGYPSYSYVMKYLLTFTPTGIPLLKSTEGVGWVLNTPRNYIPNRLNETNLSNWEFVTDETD